MELMSEKEYIPNNFVAASRKRLTNPVPVHIHEFFEIEFIISGSGVCSVDGIEYSFSAGDVFCLSPINTHEIKSADAEIFNVMYRCGGVEERLFLSSIDASRRPLITLSEDDERLVYHLLSELVTICDTDTHYAGYLLMCILKKLESKVEKRSPELVGYARRAILYIIENFKSKITLADVASHIGLTPTYFSGLFKKEVGVRFSDYLDNVRFSYAKNLLCFTDFPVLNIVQMSGFEDYANFAKRFKRLFGVTPGEFRKHIG